MSGRLRGACGKVAGKGAVCGRPTGFFIRSVDLRSACSTTLDESSYTDGQPAPSNLTTLDEFGLSTLIFSSEKADLPAVLQIY